MFLNEGTCFSVENFTMIDPPFPFLLYLGPCTTKFPPLPKMVDSIVLGIEAKR